MDLNPPPPSSSSGFSSFPILAIALLAIMVTCLLLVTYYIVVIKCCINRPTRGGVGPRVDDSSWMTFSPGEHLHSRGVDELVLRDIPTVKYKGKSSRFGSKRSLGERSFRGCAVCLSEFQDQEMLRVLPHCGHVFHLDCIDVWLINNANCPLCRSNILGAPPKTTLEQIVAPASSPQEIILPTANTNPTSDDQFVVIEIEGGSDGSGNNKGIRRSFSMDSVADRRLLMQVQEIIRQNSSSSNRSFRRSLFSFGQGQGSKSAILPVQPDL